MSEGRKLSVTACLHDASSLAAKCVQLIKLLNAILCHFVTAAHWMILYRFILFRSLCRPVKLQKTDRLKFSF